MMVVSMMCIMPMTSNFQFHIAAFDLLECGFGIWCGVLIARAFQDMLNLSDRHHRSYPNEDQVEREEDTECSDINPYLHYRRHIETPAGWEIIPGQCRRDNDEAFKPHSDVYENGHQEGDGDVTPDFL